MKERAIHARHLPFNWAEEILKRAQDSIIHDDDLPSSWAPAKSKRDMLTGSKNFCRTLQASADGSWGLHTPV